MTHRVLKCNEFKTLFAEWPIRAMSASLTLLQVTADLPLPYGGMAASDGHAAIAFSTAGGSIDEAEACTQRFPSSVHPSGDRWCWCMTELSQQLQLLPAIGADQEHCPVMLTASVSTLETMLSLSVTTVDEGAGASPSWSCALVMICGAGTMQEDHTRSLLKSQGSSRSCRQDTALGVHCLPLRPQRGGGLEEEPGGRAGPRSKIQTKPSYCIL